MNKLEGAFLTDADDRVTAPASAPARRALPARGELPARSWRHNLAQIAWLRPLLASRWPQFILRLVTLAGFVFTITAGLFGSPVGSHNFAIIFVWIAWWSALKLAFIPLGGRSWCSMCPIPLPGEWLQSGGILHKSRQRLGQARYGLNLRWPKRLRGSWLQSAAFLLIGLFSALTLTDPRVTAWVLLGLFVLAFTLSLVFERRAFCSYLCPIGGFSGMYAKTAPIELRVIAPSVCAAHAEKTCYQACPWGLYPLALRDSAQCSLCLECLRVCPSDNIALNLRPFGSDLGAAPLNLGLPAARRTPASPAKPRLDETFLALVMLGSALAFAAVFTGHWGSLKAAAFGIGSPAWWLYSLAFLALNLLVLPGAFSLAVWFGLRLSSAPRSPGSAWQVLRPTKLRPARLSTAIARQAQALLPLGLFAWIAFTISFALPKLNTVLAVLSDPFGWGWDLFGTAGTTWTPDVSAFSPLVQVALLLVGLFWSASLALELALASRDDPPDRPYRAAVASAAPVMAFCLAYTFLMLVLLVG